MVWGEGSDMIEVDSEMLNQTAANYGEGKGESE